MQPKCYICGKNDETVFFEFIPQTPPNYIVHPICVNCKSIRIKNDIVNSQLMEIKKWETELNNLENIVATKIVNTFFANIKFKEHAKTKLIKIMKKYSIRAVFEICNTYNLKKFNIHEIENKIKQSIK